MDKDNKETPSYELNSWYNFNTNYYFDIFNDYKPDDIKNILSDPISNNEQIRKLSRLVYNTNPIVSNAIDYIVSLPSLSHILFCKGNNKKALQSKEVFENVLDSIKDKEIIRDALHRDCIDGACYYYYETISKTDNTKFLDDYEVHSIYEINQSDDKVAIISLPTDYVKIKGYKNNRPVIVFNLEYFNEFSGGMAQRKIKMFPKEIRDGYSLWVQGKSSGNWLVLDNNKTIVHKIKSSKREPYGRPITISALIDIFYSDYLTTTKRSVLGEVNNKIIYQTLPEGTEKGKCSLTKTQQEEQHKTVKNAVMNKNNLGGTSFFTVAAGTKIDSVDTSVDILNEDIEPNLDSKIAMGLGYALGLLDGKSGSYSSQRTNLELLFGKVYTWVSEIASEIEYVINKNTIKNKSGKITLYYLPTSFINRDKFVSTCKELYMSGSGSKSMWIASTGIDVDAYKSLMEYEKENKWDELFSPHPTSYNSSGNVESKTSGRPEVDNSTNDSTLATKANNTNLQPKPSTK